MKYGHSLPSAGSYQLPAKECALRTAKLPRRLSEVRNRDSLERLTDRAENDLKIIKGP